MRDKLAFIHLPAHYAGTNMKLTLSLVALFFLASCANEPGEEYARSTAPTKAEVKAREDFASTLPKPRER